MVLNPTSNWVIVITVMILLSSECVSGSLFDGIKNIVNSKVWCSIGFKKECALRAIPKPQLEHGSLDFIGRDLIRIIKEKLSEDDTDTALPLSNKTKGLDSDQTFSGGSKPVFEKKLKAIYPGTKWCGDGDTAASYQDLGVFEETDRCCREHDHCSNYIEAGKSKYGLYNTGLLTRNHCSCDHKFYECLKKADTPISKSVGITYFNIIGLQCFREEHQVLSCARSSQKKCASYRVDPNSKKSYQWFDSPPF